MSNIFTSIFGTYSERELKRINPIVKKIELLREEMISLDEDSLKNKINDFKNRYEKGESLDSLLPESFAVVREATRRLINQEHFRVQLIGGIILHQGRISEMKTGEGKSQTALLPAYLNAISGKPVFIVTVNDYLAKRDATELGDILRYLGVTVGCSLTGMTPEEKREQYNCDVVYVTNNELGFDYLRDNMAIRKEDCVLRDLSYAIIDEVDSILIDEARTPLIISGQGGKSTKLYETCDILAKRLKRGKDIPELSKTDYIMGIEIEEDGDFLVNEKEKVITLTSNGVKKVEEFFNIENLADAENLEIQHNIILALRAHNLMFKDKDYVVKDDQVLIVDEFTGRIMDGRRFSDGLHQAIEAKEHVNIKRESRTLATITFQNFFNKFEKKSGMTGTALTEDKEFRDIYGLDVVSIPTNVPVQRLDEEDKVYKTKKAKFEAICKEIERIHAIGQPILVGTITIETSELLSNMLKKKGIKHNVLNAKFHEMEAEIISQAGTFGAVTIATNMAGRGTDIKLDEKAREVGGLVIIGTERHESRRIDNQLRGRSGRQGDPGRSIFYISIEDDVMRLFGSEKLIEVFNALKMPDNQEIEHKMLSNTIESAQKKIESNNFGIRKNVLEYDQVMNEQREIVYSQRKDILNGDNMNSSILDMIKSTIDYYLDLICNDDTNYEEWDLNTFYNELLTIIPLNNFNLNDINFKNKKELSNIIYEKAIDLYNEREQMFENLDFREIERVILLKSIDLRWMDHIDDMDQLRQGIGLQAYAQKDPKIEYRISGYEMFEEMTQNIKIDTINMLFHIKPVEEIKREQVVKATGTNKEETIKAPKRRENKKIYPNDPCSCGSGKKYKFCCGSK